MNSNLINKKNIIICLLGLCVLGGIIYIVYNNSSKKYVPEFDKDARIVKNFNDFYTINNCINKFLRYVNNKETKAVTSLLTNDYKKKNNINENNVLSKLSLEENSIFITKKVLYKYVDENEYIYYVYGLQGKNNITMDSNFDESKAKDAYYIVYTKDTSNNKIFSLEPYNGEEFINGVGQ